MSYSQFKDVTLASGPPPRPPLTGTGNPDDTWVEVSGPLSLDPNVTYVMPITVVFSIIQNVKTADGKVDHDAKKARRRGGCVQVDDPKATEWRTTIGLPPEFEPGDARGVGVAVLEQVTQFGIETITWCDHIELPNLSEGRKLS
jgi:hypothetical protein